MLLNVSFKSLSLVQIVSSNSLCVGWKIHAFGSQQWKNCVYRLPSRIVEVRKLTSSDRRDHFCPKIVSVGVGVGQVLGWAQGREPWHKLGIQKDLDVELGYGGFRKKYGKVCVGCWGC